MVYKCGRDKGVIKGRGVVKGTCGVHLCKGNRCGRDTNVIN